MFREDEKLYGKHAYYLQKLSPRSKEYAKVKLFNRYIDVYMIGAVLGYINGIKEERDRTSEYKSEEANIPLTTILNEEDNIMMIYRTILLLENKDVMSEEERMERAFKDDLFEDRSESKKENDELFDSYVRGGISYLYEKLYNETLNLDDRIERIQKFVKEFHDEFYLEVHLEDIDYEKDKVY